VHGRSAERGAETVHDIENQVAAHVSWPQLALNC
jgi:hypothetical protein